jgi:hypothetical protein
MQEAVLFLFLFRLRGGSFLQELYDFEKILAVKKVNADTLQCSSNFAFNHMHKA